MIDGVSATQSPGSVICFVQYLVLITDSPFYSNARFRDDDEDQMWWSRLTWAELNQRHPSIFRVIQIGTSFIEIVQCASNNVDTCLVLIYSIICSIPFTKPCIKWWWCARWGLIRWWMARRIVNRIACGNCLELSEKIGQDCVFRL